MARILSTEKSKFINQQINIYSKNKVGQYSKFLNKTPIFVTYYSLNETESTTDVGTGAIVAELGENSPLRFNKIEEFPIYGLPELKPEIEYDETGADILMDLSDIIVLPGTIRPRPSDYLIVSIPSSDLKYLFRVNGVQYNTIQSNDFYLISLEIKRTGPTIENDIEPQVVETYFCVFEKIGTKDKCLIRNEDLKTIERMMAFRKELQEFYESIYFNSNVNNFCYRNSEGVLYYDMYLTRFLEESQIFYEENQYHTQVAVYDDFPPYNFEFLFRSSLFYTILTKSTTFLEDHLYCFATGFSKRVSQFILNNEPCYSYDLFITELEKGYVSPDDDTIQEQYLLEYFPFALIKSIKEKIFDAEHLDYMDSIIYEYITGTIQTIEYDKLMKCSFHSSRRNMLYIPVILFIIREFIYSYFKKEL